MPTTALPSGYSRVLNAKLDTILAPDGRVVGFMTNSNDQFIAYASALTGDYTITPGDDGRQFNCTTALTLTIPASLSPRPSFVVIPPSSGNASIAVSGGAQINGATSTLTRSRSSNPAGVAVVAYTDSDGYGVSGS